MNKCKQFYLGAYNFMRISRKALAVVYVIFGILFVYMAAQSAGASVWNFATMSWAIIATLDFGIALKLIRTHLRNNKKKKDKE